MEKIKESQSSTIFRKNRSPKKQNKNLISADRLPPPADQKPQDRVHRLRQKSGNPHIDRKGQNPLRPHNSR